MNGTDIDIPVYVNPDALDSVPDLRLALQRTNLLLAQQVNLVHELQQNMACMAHDIAPVVLAQMAGDADGLELALLRLIQRHVRVVALTPPATAGASGMH